MTTSTPLHPSRSAYESLVLRYADGRTLCHCQEAYYDKDGRCTSGCSANIINTRNEIADMIVKEGHYRAAWEEIERVYDEATVLLRNEPRSYLGWNWVHALVDALKNHQTRLRAE